MGRFEHDTEETTVSKTHQQVDEPPMYRVLLHNDDYTTMEFVVEVLMHIFNKPVAEATRIMLSVHESGIGLCGIYPYSVAETKVTTVHTAARENGFPLRCSLEKDEP